VNNLSEARLRRLLRFIVLAAGVMALTVSFSLEDAPSGGHPTGCEHGIIQEAALRE
jgi:hypothetical protein